MIAVQHLNAGASRGTRLVLDDFDRHRLREGIADAFDEKLLAYCLMDTHVHVTAEGPEDEAREVLRVALRSYARAFNGRHGESRGPLLRGRVEAIEKISAVELGYAIRYVHENPLRTRSPLVPDVVTYEWSSARAYAGFTCAPFVNLPRVDALLGRDIARVVPPCPELADLAPAILPRVSLEAILAAVAQVHGVLPEHLVSRRRTATLNAARGTFVVLGRLEGYRDSQLARALGRTTQRVGQLRAHVDWKGVKFARTILITPRLRARLPRLILRVRAEAPPQSQEAFRS